MKKRFFPTFLFFASFWVVLSVSCKKDSSNGFYSYIRGNLNGVSFEANSNMWATPGAAGNKIISFRGDWPSYSIRFYIDGDGSNISAGTYVFETGKICNAVIYENNDGYSAGYFSSIGSQIFRGSGRITITEISKKYIKGSFEFVTGVNTGTGQSKSVTGGEFYMKRD